MRCISPLTLRRDTGKRDVVPCGKCNFCLQTKRQEWSFRLANEWRHSVTSKFVTLTYDDFKLPRNEEGEAEIRKDHVQKFLKRLRKEQSKVDKAKIRHYAVGEYGEETMRPHYHALLFNISPMVLKALPRIWSYGIVNVGAVEPASIHYVAKYVINRHVDFGGREPPFSFMSKRPGIGRKYVDSHGDWHRADYRSYTFVNGHVGKLPRYYKEKIFEPWDRQHMSRMAELKGLEDYWKQVESLKYAHPDPESYLEELTRFKHDLVTSKLNQFDKL